MSEFSDKAKTIGFSRGRGRRPVSVRNGDGHVIGVETTDGLGNVVTEYADRQDVTIRAATVRAAGTALEAS